MQAVRLVSGLYGKQPMVGNMLLYVGLYGAGDLSRQTIQWQRDPERKHLPLKLQFDSAARLSVVGALLIAPFNYNFYKILDKMIRGNSARIVLTKVAADQLLSTPIAISLFYIGTSYLEKREDVLAELREKGPRTYMTGAVFWSCVQSVNFAFLPSTLRAPYVGCCAFFWCNILSFFKAKQPDSVTESTPQ